MKSVLILKGDPSTADMLKRLFEQRGAEVRVASGGKEGLSLLVDDPFNLVLLDAADKEIMGLDFTKHIKPYFPPNANTPAIVLTAYRTVEDALEALKCEHAGQSGRLNHIPGPHRHIDTHDIVVNPGYNFELFPVWNGKSVPGRQYDFISIIGNSEPMRKVLGLIEKIADTDSTVLITGESGTGKELIAKTIHLNSRRASRPMIAINCAAIPRELLESELFGHEKGSFTGAVKTTTGKFELAAGGTLFLDEIGELDPLLQVKILRVLEEREFERIGGAKTIKTDVRIIAATNRNLEKAAEEGKFREDLFYRLNVIPLHIPPLREIREDIPLIAGHFLDIFSKDNKKSVKRFSEDAGCLLVKYNWPGNVRELKNLMERLVLLHEKDVIDACDLPESIRDQCKSSSALHIPVPKESTDLNAALRDIELSLIKQAMELSGGVKSRAARSLGIKRTTLVEKMKKLGMTK
jgi:DNA-binding NtrC family response regulator